MRNYSRRGFGSANRQPRFGENDRYGRQEDNYNEEFGGTRNVFYDDDSDDGYKETPYRERRYYGDDEDLDRHDTSYENDRQDEFSQRGYRGERIGGLSNRRGNGSSYSNPNRYQEQRVNREIDQDPYYGNDEGYSRNRQRFDSDQPERSQYRQGNRGYQGNNRNRY